MLSRFVVSQVKHNSYFLVGLVIGLWVALACVPLEEEVAACAEPVTAATEAGDEFEPHREERPLGPAGQPGRSVTRPRYYSTELGMRGPLLAGVLSSEAALDSRVAALNRTAARLQPALRIFIAASALQGAPGRANVVGFTDTREMLKPFHALKYLADNYLEEYDFFFLVSDASFVNARRLTELVSKLSVSQDVYMGVVAEDDSQYCSLEGGILLSNSVLRAIHSELDWCVRNSYSPHHHENIGRCVLHASHQHCVTSAQGQDYAARKLTEGTPELSPELADAVTAYPVTEPAHFYQLHAYISRGTPELSPELADAVTAYPVTEPAHFYQLHAYISRVFLERDSGEVDRLRALLVHTAARHPRGYHNATWPAGLRADPGLAPPPPPTRFDHLRWTLFNASHAFMPDDHRAVGALTGATKEAVELVLRTARAWALNHWEEVEQAQLLEGAWRWEPPHALRYRLLLSLQTRDQPPLAPPSVRSVEVVRPLGGARLVSAPYVTETPRATLLLPLPPAAALPAFLKRYAAVALGLDKNTALVVVVISHPGDDESAFVAARDAVAALAASHRGAHLHVLAATAEHVPEEKREAMLQRVALHTALPRLGKDALVLMAVPHMEFNQDFLNRVRMNTINGFQWYWACGFSRYSQYAHPRFLDADGARPQQHTGRFNLHHRDTVAFYRRDYEAALAAWTGSPEASVVDILSASDLRCVRAPDPALVLAPRPAPCLTAHGNMSAECLRAHRDDAFRNLDLGDRLALAKLQLEERVGVQS